jgi:hypothetical protein
MVCTQVGSVLLHRRETLQHCGRRHESGTADPYTARGPETKGIHIMEPIVLLTLVASAGLLLVAHLWMVVEDHFSRGG